jgi:two-component sensor histidine kinase
MTRGAKGEALKVSTGLLVHSLLYVPILSKEEVLGVLSVDNRFNERAFTEMDEKLLTSLADYAAVAIENAQLYEHAQHEIIERARAEEQINASLREKEVLLKEIHHRVKNNLQVISSLLNLQSDYVSDQQALKVLQDSQHRIRSMALIHEKLYQPQDLGRIDFAEYIRDLAAYLFRSYNAGARAITWSIEGGLILNELISNSLKHAFSPDMDKPSGWVGQIRVELLTNDDHMMTLIVTDNGAGLPAGLDFRNTTSLGLQLVNTLVDQLDGTIELVGSSEGTTFKITFAAW